MNIEIVKEIYADKILVHVDRNQICRVVINLVMNAVSSMEGSGTLTFGRIGIRPTESCAGD
jgi:two-component system NtrC family sensor kinase